MTATRTALFLSAVLGALATGRAEAQGYRVRLEARGQAVSYRGLQADSIPIDQAVTGASGGQESADGYAVKCSTASWCYFYRPGDVLRSVPLSTTADLVLWGFGIRGLSLRASGRFITDAGDQSTWPGTEPNAQLLEGYLVAAALVLSAPAWAEDRWMSIPRPAPMPEPASTGMAPVNGIEMYYATYGAGDPVLLIHGGLVACRPLGGPGGRPDAGSPCDRGRQPRARAIDAHGGALRV